MVSGVIPDMSQESLDRAMAQAHEELPPLVNSAVTLSFFTIEEGLRTAGEIYGPTGVELLRAQVALVGGAEPTIVFAYRAPHHCGEHTKPGQTVTTAFGAVPLPAGLPSFMCTLPFAHPGDHIAHAKAAGSGIEFEAARWSA